MNTEAINRASVEKRRARDVEAAAKAIFWCLHSVMHGHDAEWRKCLNKGLYRECAEAALAAAR